MPRSEMTQAIERVQGMVVYVKDNLSLNEYELFLDMVAPLVEPVEQPAKKRRTRKKSSTKSSRASRLESQLKQSIELQREAKEPICTTCGNIEDYVDHSEPSPSYHPFATSTASATHAASVGD